HMVFHPSGQHLSVVNELNNTVAVYDYNTERGELIERQIVETLAAGTGENTAADIHLAPGGERLYVSNRGDESLAVFASAADGRLERIAINSCGGSWPRNFAIAPDGQFVLVANQYSNNVTVLPVVKATGALAEPRTRVAVPGASCVQFAVG